MYTAFCLTFAGFLRVGEFTYTAHDLKDVEFHKWFLTRRSVRFHDDYIKLTLPASKTDPFRQGVTLTIAATGDEAYAVTALVDSSLSDSPSEALHSFFVPPNEHTHIIGLLLPTRLHDTVISNNTAPSPLPLPIPLRAAPQW